jgi:transposase-like protein
MGKIFCPKCKSGNVKKEMDILLAIGAPQKWVCRDCGYSSFIFPEITKMKISKK